MRSIYLFNFLNCVSILFAPYSYGANQLQCTELFKTKTNIVESFKDPVAEFLHQTFSTLHTNSEIERVRDQYKENTGIYYKKPADKIHLWLKSLEQQYQSFKKNPTALNALKERLNLQYVTKLKDVSASYYLFLNKIEIQNRRVKLTSKEQKEKIENLLLDQKDSLYYWIDYLFSESADVYPAWYKFWVLNAIVKMGTFKTETATFGNRSLGQIAPFPELNHEALSLTLDAMMHKLSKKDLSTKIDSELLNRLKSPSFEKIYAYFLKKGIEQKEQSLKHIQGQWRFFDKESNVEPLLESLKEKGTGWCISGQHFAATLLAEGEFHIFYSKDKNNEFSIPRIAIHTKDKQIVEVRGVGPDQNLDPYISLSNVLDEKLKELGFSTNDYFKSYYQSKILASIYYRFQNQYQLSINELKFLYEIDVEIEGFGYKRDPIISEILASRDRHQDYADIWSDILGQPIEPYEVAFNARELKSSTKVFVGDLAYDFSKKTKTLPLVVTKSLSLIGLKNAKKYKLPVYVGGDLDLSTLDTSDDLVLPFVIGGDLKLRNLREMNNLVFPLFVGGNIDLSGVQIAKNSHLSYAVGSDVDLGSLVDAIKLRFSHYIKRDLNLSSYEGGSEILMTPYIGGTLSLDEYKFEHAQLIKFLPKSFIHHLEALPEVVKEILIKIKNSNTTPAD